ncbi:hypothetical protein OSTOST_20698 [Ostertagia ostertagi]
MSLLPPYIEQLSGEYHEKIKEQEATERGVPVECDMAVGTISPIRQMKLLHWILLLVICLATTVLAEDTAKCMQQCQAKYPDIKNKDGVKEECKTECDTS